ncbi:ATP-binding protein [Rickettsiaceae bacterium]|nr:ATP-binding protein [Rickettsiaceae bacterium]
MLKSKWKNFKKKRFGSNIIYVAALAMIIMLAVNSFFVYEDFFKTQPDPLYTLGFLLASLIAILILCVFLISNRVSTKFTFIKKGERRVSRLRKRIIVAFSIGAALPTIIVAIFSTYFFNFGIEAWFDKKISRVLNQSILVGESYIDEHILQLKETSISVSDDLSAMYYELIHNPELFSKVLNAHAEMRSIDEAIVFQKDTNTILAQTTLSFSLSFSNISAHLMQRADKGEVVQITSDPQKIRILIKLRDYNDTYLLIGRLVDAKIIDHINKTSGAAEEYFALKNQIASMQIKFSMAFILLSLILLLVATIWGRKFAEALVRPLRELVIAAEKVKNGDMSAQVPLNNLKKDEIKVLSSAFNRMVSQIDRQQKDLVIAQRALAWSDVARRVAHEIKNPLTPISLSAERLLKKFQGEVSDPQMFEKYINNILKNSGNIKSIVSEFVDFARLPAPTYTKCEIISLLSDLVESRRLINDTITYNLTANIDEYPFVCDIAQMNILIVNLLLNSEEAFSSANLEKNINVALQTHEDNLTITIEDNGPGFKEDILESAKEAYVTTKPTGTGLGLAIVERIVTDHFGHIQISNMDTGGASIRLTFDSKELKSKLK